MRFRCWHLMALALGVSLVSGLSPLAGRAQLEATGGLGNAAQRGLYFAERGRYSEAINLLEEAWEEGSAHPGVAEHLALSYLYEHLPPADSVFPEVERLMRFSLEQGGQVTVPARHLHRGLKWVTTSHAYCAGRLVISGDAVHFLTDQVEHSFSHKAALIESISLSKGLMPNSEGVLQVRLKDKTRHRVQTGTKTRSEAELLLRLALEFTIGG